MTRKMAYIGLSYITGLFFASFFAPIFNTIIAISVISILAIYIVLFHKKQYTGYVVIMSFCIALIFNAIYSFCVVEKITAYSGNKVTISGNIEEKTLLEGGRSRYLVKGDFANIKNAKVYIYATSTNAQIGDKFTAKITPIVFENSMLFDEESYYKAKGIYLKSYKAENVLIEENKSFSITKKITSYRNYISNKINSILPNDEGDFITSIVCGDKTALSDDVKTSLYRSGIGHITSVSGTHLMIIASLLYLVLNMFAIRKLPKFLILEVSIISYAIFSGASISVIRAAIMFSLVISADLFLRNADAANSLGIAGIILTITNPFLVRDASFLLSFTGVIAIAVIAPFINSYFNFKGKFKSFKKSIVAMICVSIFTMPFVITLFDELSIISPLSNIFLAPIYTIILICGFLVVITGGISIFIYPILLIAGLLTKLLIFLCNIISSIKFTYVSTASIAIQIAVPLCVLGIILICIKFKTRKSVVASVLSSIIALLLINPIIDIVEVNNLKISILSQPNCTALVLNKNDQTCIIDIDGGGRACNIVETYLSKNGLDNVNSIILTTENQNSLSSYMTALSCNIDDFLVYNQPDIIYPESISVFNFGENSKAEFGDISVIRTSQNEFLITYGNFKINISASQTNLNELFLSIDKNIVLSKGGRQLYGFDKSDDFALFIDAKNSGKYKVRGSKNALCQ